MGEVVLVDVYGRAGEGVGFVLKGSCGGGCDNSSGGFISCD